MDTLPPHNQNDNTLSDNSTKRKSGAQPGNKNALGYRHTEETKQRYSETRKGHPAYEKQRQSAIEANKRRAGQPRKPFTEEHRKRLSESKKKKWADPEWKETQTKMMRERFEQPEAIEKMRQGVTAHWATLTHEEKMTRLLPGITASSAISGNTSIEIIVAQTLETLNVDFEPQKQIGPYFVDFFIEDKGLVVEVMGCFWHGCLQCGHDTEKDQAKRAKDKKRNAYLVKCGYKVHYIWEHDIKQGLIDVMDVLS